MGEGWGGITWGEMPDIDDGGIGEGKWRQSWEEIAWGEMPDVGEGEEGSKTHCHLCIYATILHVLHMYPKT